MNAENGSNVDVAAEKRLQQLVMDHRWLVRLIALRLKAHGVRAELAELLAAGMVGLMEAARTWPAPASFVRWAWKRVEGAMLDSLRSEQRYRRVTQVLTDVGHEYIDATDNTTDPFLESPEAVARQIVDDVFGYYAASFIGAVVGMEQLDPEALYAAREEWDRALDTLGHALAELPERDQKILGLRYEQGLDLKEIATRLIPPVPYSTATAYHRDALVRLGKKLRARGLASMPQVGLLDRNRSRT